MRQERVISGPSSNACGRSFLERCEILFSIERYHGEALPNAFEEEQNLVSAEPVPAGQPCECGIDLGQAVGAAERLVLPTLEKNRQAGFVMLVVLEETGNQDGSVEK